MADNEKIMDSDKDPKVSTLSDLPDEIPNELPHQTALLNRHAILEKSPTLLLVFSLLVVSIGGIVEIAPLFWLENTIEEVEGVRPYSPLELTGRDIYVREGCYLCHSQMIRPMRDEVETHRSRRGACGRSVFRRMARRPPDRSAVGRAGIDHAVLCVPVRHPDRTAAHRGLAEKAPFRGRAL